MMDELARLIYDQLEGPVNNQDAARQSAQWMQSQDMADAIIAYLREYVTRDEVVERAARLIIADTRPNMDPDALTPCPRGRSGFVPKWTMYEPMTRAALASLGGGDAPSVLSREDGHG